MVIFDNFSRPRVSENTDWLRARHRSRVRDTKGDNRDQNAVREVVKSASAVIHLAAQVAVTTSVAQPIEDFEINARGTLNLLDAIAKYAPQTPLVFASTNKVYGKLVADDTPDMLTGAEAGASVVRLVVKGRNGTALSENDVSGALSAVAGVASVERADGEGDGTLGFRVRTVGALDPREGIFRTAVEKSFVLLDLHRERASLEDTFRQLTVGEGGKHA